MRIHDPEALQEVQAAFARYEAALMADDLEAMDALFWHSPLTVRLGVGQNLYGIEAIRAFRAGRGGSPRRTLSNTVITTFGRDFATASMADGWKIVSAHVSMLGEGS